MDEFVSEKEELKDEIEYWKEECEKEKIKKEELEEELVEAKDINKKLAQSIREVEEAINKVL